MRSDLMEKTRVNVNVKLLLAPWLSDTARGVWGFPLVLTGKQL